MLTRYLALPTVLLELAWTAVSNSSSYSILSNNTSSSIPVSTSTLEITSFITATASTGTGNGTSGANATGLEYASSCNQEKLEWIENRGSTYVSNTTFTTSTASTSYTIIRSGWIETYGDTALYTLCDGYPRINASTEFKTLETTPTQIIWSTFPTQTEVWRNASAPTCSFGSRECSALWLEYRSASLAWSEYYFGTGSAPYAPAPTEPVCGRPTVPPQTQMTLPPAACVYNHATIQLLYWPVSTVGNRLCGNNWTTVEATPTIEGHPNTAVAFNTTLTSPTVYMVLSGAYENGPNYSTGKAINGILPIASDRVSSMCDQGGRMGPPEAMDYADFDAPIPADKYRCQPACWTKPDYPQSWQNSAYNITATENLCSTIYDGVYKPALQVPVEEFNSFYANYTNGVGLDFEGLQCSFSPGTDGIFYDPPSALQQVQNAPGPTVPGSPDSPGKTTTKEEEPKTTPPSPGSTIPTALPQTTGGGGNEVPQPTQPSGGNGENNGGDGGDNGGSGGDNGGSNNSGGGGGGGSNDGDGSGGGGDGTADDGANNDEAGSPDAPSDPTGTQNIGGLIASIIGVTREDADPGQAEQTPSPQYPSSGASDLQGASDPSNPSDPDGSAGGSASSDNGADAGSGQQGAEQQDSEQTGQGAILTDSSGETLTAIRSGDRLVLPSTTIILGQGGSIEGLGSISAASEGLVQDGQTIPYQTLSPSSPGGRGADVYAVDGQSYTADSSGNIVVAPGVTISAGGSAVTVSGTTYSLGGGDGEGEDGALVVNGVTATATNSKGSGTASSGLPQQTGNSARRIGEVGSRHVHLSVALGGLFCLLM